VDFAKKFTYKLANAREGKSFGGRVEDGKESKSKKEGSTREIGSEVSLGRPEGAEPSAGLLARRITDRLEQRRAVAERPQPFIYFQAIGGETSDPRGAKIRRMEGRSMVQGAAAASERFGNSCF